VLELLADGQTERFGFASERQFEAIVTTTTLSLSGLQYIEAIKVD